MHRNVLLGAGALVYYALAVYALSLFDSGILTTSLILFGVPAYFLARYSAAPSAVIVAVITLGLGIAIILEGVAHIYGIWYTIGVDELRLFGLIPIEVFASSVIQTLFLALLYELIFDDGIYTASHARVRYAAFIVFCISVLGLLAIHQYILKGIFFSHSYVWILGVLVASTLATLAVHKSLTVHFFDRLVLFSVAACVPLLANLYLAVVNTHKVFAHVGDYLYTLTIGGNTFPVEELALALVMPLFIATFYELYLDDAK
jgi:hypothetical protein